MAGMASPARAAARPRPVHFGTISKSWPRWVPGCSGSAPSRRAAELRLARALRLPTFEAGGMTLIKRLTLVVRDGLIEHVFYPVFPPDASASQVTEWARDSGRIP